MIVTTFSTHFSIPVLGSSGGMGSSGGDGGGDGDGDGGGDGRGVGLNDGRGAVLAVLSRVIVTLSLPLSSALDMLTRIFTGAAGSKTDVAALPVSKMMLLPSVQPASSQEGVSGVQSVRMLCPRG